MRRLLRRLSCWLTACAVTLAASPVAAHPLPNALVVVKPGFGRVTLDIDAPADDLAIALHAERGDATPVEAATVAPYVLKHVALTDPSGRRLPLVVEAARLIEARDPEVGRYREWQVTLAAATETAPTGRYALAYDAVIHQIPNQFALVRIEPIQPAAGAVAAARDVGVIRYDFASGVVHPLTLDLATGGVTSGFAAMIAVGFVHVLSGLDHLLFLAALLMVAPFEAQGGRWRFRGMDRAAVGRFAAISGAFTLGHSASLAAGTFGFDAVPARLTETLVAVSIVVAAVHALRPLFPGREWWVAGGFGLVHGLAFSETLAALDLGLRGKIGALFGFNIGVELAQLAAMAIAFPLLLISGAKPLVRPRQAALIAIAGLGAVWIGQRAFGLPLPTWLDL